MIYCLVRVVMVLFDPPFTKKINQVFADQLL